MIDLSNSWLDQLTKIPTEQCRHAVHRDSGTEVGFTALTMMAHSALKVLRYCKTEALSLIKAHSFDCGSLVLNESWFLGGA